MTSDPTRIILARHGHHDPDGRFEQHRCSGLTDLGHRQADRLARRLRADEPGIDTMLTSLAARTVETGTPVADALGIPATATCDLCEMHPGEAEGLTVAEMNARFGPNYASVPGAEYFPDWLPGATRRLRQLADTYNGHTVLAVTHSGVVRASFVAFGGMPKETANALTVDNTGLTIWSRPTDTTDPRRDVWALERHNDTGHLE